MNDKNCGSCGYFLCGKYGHSGTCNLERTKPRAVDSSDVCDQWLKPCRSWYEQHWTPQIVAAFPGTWRYVYHKTDRDQWLLENGDHWVQIDFCRSSYPLFSNHLYVQYFTQQKTGFQYFAKLRDLLLWLKHANECIFT